MNLVFEWIVDWWVLERELMVWYDYYLLGNIWDWIVVIKKLICVGGGL